MTMDNEIEALESELEPDDSEEVDTESDDSEGSEEQPDRLALLEAEIAALKNQTAQNIKAVKDFSAAVGRYQSLSDRLESGRGDTEKLTRELSASVTAVDKVLETILSAEDISPELRARAVEVRNRAKAEAELADLKATVEALRTAPPQREAQAAQTDLSPLEVTLNTMIMEAGFKPTVDFDWAAITEAYKGGGDGGAIKYVLDQITEKRTEAQATARRQARRTEAGQGTPRGAAPGADFTAQLEAAADKGDIDKGIELLKSIGVNPF